MVELAVLGLLNCHRAESSGRAPAELSTLGNCPVYPFSDLISREIVDPQCATMANPIHHWLDALFLTVWLKEFRSGCRTALPWQVREPPYPVGFFLWAHLPFDWVLTVLTFAELTRANELNDIIDERALPGGSQHCDIPVSPPRNEVR